MMTLDIDITEKRTEEIIEILETYYRGHLEIKFERVFWVSDSSGIQSRDNPADPPGNRRDSRSKPLNIGERFQKSLDALGSMVGPPQQESRRRY